MKALMKKVLVVDDDPVIGRSFERVLFEKGYAVTTAHDGREALSKLDAENYDVVFTDIRMPGMDGLEVAERVRTKRPWIPVVIVTGYGTAANEARAEALGVAGFLRKPLSPEMIEGSAREALREKKATAAPLEEIEAVAAPAVAKKERASEGIALFLKNVALLIAAPFIALAYIVVFPFIGIGALAWMAARAFMRRSESIARFVKNVALFFAAPFVGLAYILAFPFVAIGMLIWLAARAWMKRSTTE